MSAVGFGFLGAASRLHKLFTSQKTGSAICLAVVVLELGVPPLIGIPASAVGLFLNGTGGRPDKESVAVSPESWLAGFTRLEVWPFKVSSLGPQFGLASWLKLATIPARL